MKLLKSYLIAYLTLLIFVHINSFDLDLGLENSKSKFEFEADKVFSHEFIVETSTPPLNAHLLTKMHAFIYPNDDLTKVTSDAYDLFDLSGENLVVYRADGQTKVKLDVQFVSWYCEKKKFCDYTTFLTKITSKDLNVDEMKNNVSTYLTNANVNVNQCFGELYNNEKGNKALIFCFTEENHQTNFLNVLGNINDLDFKDPTNLPYDLTSRQTFSLNITDGHEAFEQKDVTFKDDGAYIGQNLLYRYDQIEVLDSKKCKIESRVPVIPMKFLTAEIYNPTCVIRIKYNRIDTYFGSTDKNCNNILKYIRFKTVKNCRAVKKGPSSMFINDLKSLPEQGVWQGWVYYYQIGSGPIKNSFHLLNIDKKNVTLSPHGGGKQIRINYNNLIWACDNDGACNFKEYVEYLTWTGQDKKLEEFNRISPQIKPIWSLPDINSCFVLEAKKSHVICPTDNDEETNMKLALALAIDYTLVDGKAQPLRDYQLGGKYKVLYATDSKGKFTDITVVTRTEGVRDIKTNELIVDFSSVLPLKSIKCGFEFRHINLPVSMHEIDPLCCTRYFTDENNYLCISPSSKCYIEIRKLVKLFRSRCIAFQDKDAPSSSSSNSNKKFDNKDAAKTGKWKGPVVFNVLDNFKYKGELAMFKGILETDEISLNYTVKGKPKFSFLTQSLEFGCQSGEPCLPSAFYKSQEPYLEERYDKDWIKNTYDKFFSKNKDILEEDCMVITSREPEYETSEIIITCVLEKGEGKNLRQAIKTAHFNRVPQIDHIANKEDFKYIPAAYDSMKFNVYLMSYDSDANTDKLAAVSTILLVTQFGVMYKKSKEYLFKWDQAIDKNTLKELINFNPQKNEVPPSFITLGADPKCCFLVEGGGKKNFLCLSDLNKCMMDKSYLFKRIYKGIMHAKSLIIINNKKKKNNDNISIDDPFDFGIKPKFKNFPPNYNLLSLSVDQFDNSKNGKWYGWIFHQSLTERNYRLVTRPVFMRIEKAKIYLQTDVNEKPYKKIRLFEYKQLCKKPCLPSEYLKIYSSMNTFDDQMYLKKSINGVLAELVKPYGENACTILDFENPSYLYGYSEMFCAIDDAQGPKIREAIENAYYIGLLNLDIDNQVKKISWENDKYFGRLIIEDKVQNFNYFYLNSAGLIGVKVSEDKGLKERFPEGSEKYTLNYNQILNDNYGTQCAFWYKGLKLREKSNEIKLAVSDNNCCIRFFVLPEKKKVELCTFLLNEGICIRESRELMKGLKDGCKFNKKYALPPDEGRDKKPKMSDTYSDSTLDDHTNGIFHGSIYASNLLNASQGPPVNPYLLKVNKDLIEIFKNSKSTTAIYTINVDEIQFNCKGYKPCSASEFKIYAEDKQNYLKFLSSLATQYNTYQDNYPAIKKSFGTGCFVIETSTAPYMICPYDMKYSENIQKAIIQAFTLHHGCKKLSTVKDAEKNTVFTIVSSINGQQKEHNVVVNVKGVVDTKTDEVILNYKILDKDPVSNKKCGVWYHGVEIPFSFDHKECCFMYSTEKKEKYMCIKDERVCIGRAYQLMKQIWSGCMFDSPVTETSDNSKPANAEVYGEENYKEKTPFDPNDFKYDICSERRDAKIFDNENLIEKPYKIDKFNDIIYSLEKTVYKGWFDLYPVTFKKEPKFSMMHVYGELNPESFKFYKKPGDKAPLFVMRPDMLSVSCQSGSTCTPLEYGKVLVKADKKNDVIAGILESKENLYEMKNDQGCAILENEINGEENNYMICINVKKPRTENYVLSQTIKDFNYSARRTAISNKYGSIIRRIIYDARLISTKFIRVASLPVSGNPVTQIRVSKDEKILDYFDAKVNDNGLSTANGLAINFEDLDSCDVYYNLVYVKEKTLFNKKRECCFRFQSRAVFEYVCLNTFNCEYNTLAIARDFYEKCLIKKDRKRSVDIIYNELNTGKHFLALDYIRRLFRTYRINIIDFNKVNLTPFNLSTISFHNKFRAIIIKYLFDIKNFFHLANLVQIDSANEIQNDPNAPPTKGLNPIFTGKSKQFSILISKGLKGSFDKQTVNIFETSDGRKLTVIDSVRYVLTKNYVVMCIEKVNEPNYFLMIFEVNGTKYFFEMYSDGNNTFTVDPINLSIKLEEIKENFKNGLNYDI